MESWTHKALELFRSLGDKQGEALSMGHCGVGFMFAGNYRRTEENLSEAKSFYDEQGLVAGSVICLLRLGQIAWLEGNSCRAKAMIRESLVISASRQLGFQIATIPRELVFVARAENDNCRAARLFGAVKSIIIEQPKIGRRIAIQQRKIIFSFESRFGITLDDMFFESQDNSSIGGW